MRTGRIINTGVRNLSGEIRRLSIKDQLQQVVNLRGVNTINHPIHGVINVTRSNAIALLNSGLSEGHLIRLKVKLFND